MFLVVVSSSRDVFLLTEESGDGLEDETAKDDEAEEDCTEAC